ncbi:CDP-glycerol glycerophosphotransferase family protein [Salinicoccus sp. ID82-1]|uniref:CDP-glycerol glycerophosphotransferase family protein n=1 Tax=Salinicoccus sp. ID82-1 TaxID=2820269 RepID=UPI001F1A653A|nr:CDP-glycerol glycerophosphotransferase family protein [Salinicoccus sp. ID82-1]MCG1009941.1 CDP-glycerol glycerophosphotransferase family protein [Salinicoccus sp. ID82-1]
MNTFRRKIGSRLRKRVPRNIREYLIKKVTLHDVETHAHHFTINLTLKNFMKYQLEHKLEIELSSAGTKYVLDYRIEQNRLQIEIPYIVLDDMDGRASIELKYNQKQMIVGLDGDEESQRLSFFSNDKYFNVSTQGSLVIENLLPGYRFNMEEPVEVDHLSAAYGHLHLEFKERMDSECHLACLYQSRLRVLENVFVEDDTLVAEDFNTLTEGHPTLYLLHGHELAPLTFSGDALTMDTMNHEITYLSEDGYLTLEITKHEIELTRFDASVEDDHINMQFAFNSPATLHTLLIVDATTGETVEVPFSSSEETMTTEIHVPLSALIDTVSRKRLVLVTSGPEPIRLQLNISNLDTIGFPGRFQAEYQHEVYKIWFYGRRDGLLGFNVAQRPLRRQVVQVDDFTLHGYIKGQDAFIDCTPHLAFVDRYSQEYARVEVDERFRVDLRSVDIIDIKSKDKTVIDLFVEIVHSSGAVLRREKIKLKDAVYKKDTHYGRQEIMDSLGNTHYHLITITPFNNLKLESFMIPSSIELPEDRVEKDMNVWLLGERYDTAQDNGYAMFRWLKAHTDIEAYYVIEDTSEDYQKIREESNILRFGSKMHFDVAFRAGVLLGTHDLENLLPYKAARGFFGYEDTVKIFLQHGVLGRKPVEYHRKYYDLPFDLFIVSSEAEKRDVVMNRMGYSDEEVAVTGLARFDLLPYDNAPKDILLMPTWRDWINTDEMFLDSEYYARYNSLIHNARLNRLLEDNDVRLNFYPHYRAQGYFNDEHMDLGPNIRFIRLGQQTVQDLLIQHALLITDFSSVSFDFTLMQKPVAYYHFDAKRFFRQGSLRPIPETFIGDIAHTEEALVDAIEAYIHNGFQPKTNDLSGIFTYQDHNNRRRIHDAVMDKINSIGD